MQWRLKNLRISNFKFFYGNVDIPLDGKNLLLYGENGSGKSSIYWSLYTILQSCLKPDKPSATKYFEYDNQENLRNKFAKDSDYSGIVLEFVHSDGRTRTYENSTIRTNTQADDFIIKTAANSGFMNYKFLSSLFDFKNSEQNNIFKLIENQIFPFLNFKKDYTLIPYDNYVTSSNVGSWWKYINRCLIENGVLPRSNRKKNSILENTVQYNAYRKLINSFNNNLKELFDGIIEFANKKIDETFKLPIKLELSYEPAAFNILKPGTKKAKDSKLHEPKIILSAQYIHDLANDHTVYHPRSFFNEAKLTVVALALRMAIYEQTASYNDNSNCSEILVIDDLLISLDMGYRLKVIDVILDYVNKGKQLIFLTHDRALFNLVKNKIDVNGWKVLEMFSKYEGYSNDEIPVPVIYTSKSYLELAHKYIKTFDFPAAANALRKDCEYLLNRLYPDNFKSTVGENGTIEELTLYGLICKLPKFYEYFDIPIKESNLDTYRERLLNPFSHDDLKTPLYRQELLLALNEVEELHKYKIAQIFSDEMIGKDSFHIEILNQLGEIEEANFIFLDRFYVIRVNDNYYYSNSRVKVINCSLNKTWHNDKEGKFRRLAKDLLNKANVEENHTFLLENVFAPPDGKSFMEIVDNLI